MNQQDYERYIAAFNARDYDGLLAFIHEDVAMESAGYLIRGHAGIRRLYAFLHHYVRETVALRHFLPGNGIDFADVMIRFEGIKTLSAQRLREEGYERMTPVPAGGVVDIEFFITYESERGKITRIRCAVAEPVDSPVLTAR